MIEPTAKQIKVNRCIDQSSRIQRRIDEMIAEERDELVRHIEELQGDINIAVHLGNLTLASNLKDSLSKAEKDLS